MKKKILLISILAFAIFWEVPAQSCLPNGYTFNTQAKIDNFSSTYPDCTQIEGDVLIEGDDISNLNGNVNQRYAASVGYHQFHSVLECCGLDIRELYSRISAYRRNRGAVHTLIDALELGKWLDR